MRFERFVPVRELDIEAAIEEYFAEKEALGALSQTSVTNRQYELRRFARFCRSQGTEKVSELSRGLLIAYLRQQRIAKASKLGILYILSSFMDFLVTEELILDNPAAAITKPRAYLPKTDYLTEAELARLFQAELAQGSPKMTDRNLLLFGLFTDICLRVSETVHLQLADVRLDAGEIWVTRKRGKTERLPLNQELIQRFERWYAVRPAFKGADRLPWVFLSSHGKPLKPRQVHNIVSQALKRAGVHKRKHGPHLLRHSGASLKARAGENLIMIQYLLGHENLNTTRRYLHFDWEDLKGLVERSPGIMGGQPETA